MSDAISIARKAVLKDLIKDMQRKMLESPETADEETDLGEAVLDAQDTASDGLKEGHDDSCDACDEDVAEKPRPKMTITLAAISRGKGSETVPRGAQERSEAPNVVEALGEALGKRKGRK